MRTAEVEWTGGLEDGAGKIVSTSTGALPVLAVSWNARIGEGQVTTSPEELLAAAHASCFAMQFSALLARAGGEPKEIHVRSDVSFELGVGVAGSHLTVTASVDGLGDERIRELAEEAKRTCPVSRALAGIDISLDLPGLTPAGAPAPAEDR